ncbi:hypothetical protein SASPL_135889 [Salvia splendens]|uniref:Disease resistance protein RPM1 n=1 Tax=Salvia splendens TaxID=180675 RepID=A0A8X8ZG49_SALSN|nr:hypothetical protein SASPL_135889 [Salvia splendens]
MEGEAAAAVLQVVVQNLIDHSKKGFLLVQEMRTIPDGSVKMWLKKLENVAFDADNVLDEFNYHLLCKQIKPILPIQPIKQKSINKEAADLGLKLESTNEPTLPDANFETNSFTLDPIFIGRDEEVSKLVEILSDSITFDERASIYAIVGMGGLGKTTLTRKVFNLLKEEDWGRQL